MSCNHLILETEKRYDFKNAGIRFESAYHCSIKESNERDRLDLVFELIAKGFENTLSGSGCPFLETGEYEKCPRYCEKKIFALNTLKTPA